MLKAIIELGGMKQVAEKLRVGQMAQTKHLRALENCFGLFLMDLKNCRLMGDIIASAQRLPVNWP